MSYSNTAELGNLGGIHTVMKDLKFLCNPGACGLIGCFLFIFLSCIALEISLLDCFSTIGSFLCTLCIGLPGAAIGALIGTFLKRTFDPEDAKTNITSSKSVADQIAELKKLLDSGALTQEEFDEQKKKILNS